MQNYSFSFLARRLTLLWLALFGSTAIFTVLPLAHAQTQPTWTAVDIGGVGQSGSSAYDQQSGAYTLSGAGSGAAASADALHFLNTPLHGNGQIVAHLGGLQGGSSPAAGLMIRESQDASAKMVGLFAAANGSVKMAQRAAIADVAQVSDSSVAAAANWLKLVRRGDEFVAFSSPDGTNWLLVGAATVPMTQDVLVGMSASSGDVSSLCSAVFDQVALSRVDVAMLTGGHHGSLALKADGTVWQWGSDDPYSGSPYELPALMQPTQVAGLDHAVAVASGEYHSLALRSDGTVWAWGNNWNGQLGPRVEPNWELPDQIVGLDHVVAIAAAPGLSVALRADGTVWAWGANYCGQLADGSTADNGTPRQVANLDNVIAIAAGGAHVLALKSDGTLWGWGESYAGQVGDGTEGALVLSPVQVSGLGSVIAMAAGGYHSLAVQADGTVWAWGADWSGQLGDGTTDQHPIPVQITGISDAFAVAAGDAHSLALKSDGTVWAWGANSLGEVGNNSTDDAHAPVQVGGLNDIARIGAGRTHSLAGRLSDGKVWGWGEGYRFKLGDGGQQMRLTPARTASFRLDDGVSPVAEPTVSPVGSGGYDSPGPITIDCATPGAVIRYTLDGSEPTDSSTLYTGPLTLTGRFTLKAKAFLPDGSESDLAGVSFSIMAPPPTISPAGGLFSMPVALTLASANPASAIHYTLNGSVPDENSSLYSGFFLLGGSAQVQASAFLSDVAPSDIAFANYTIYETAAAPVISPAGAAFDNSTEVTLTSATAGAIIRYTTDGSEPGVGATLSQGPFTSSESIDLKARAFLPGMNASAVVEAQFSENSTVATPILSVPGGVYARAQNSVVSCATPGAEIHYTLDGSEPTLSSPIIASGTSVAVTDSFVALIARAWKDGQSVSGLAEADYWINGMVAAGLNHTVALKADGSVWTWGDNGCGQLGSGGYDPSASPIQAQGLSDVVAVAAGLNCSAALKADGTVWVWGLNDRAQLGGGTYDYQSNVPVQIVGLSDVKAIAAGEAHFLALKADGSVWGWGNDDCGQLGQGATSAPVTTPVQVPGLGHVAGIAAGQSHSLAVRLEGDVWAWGRNDRGQIGDSTYEWRFLPVPVTGISTAKAVVAGQNHSLALLADGTVQAWGDDVFGQLGDGQGQPPQENSPVGVLGLGNVVQLASGANYSVALKGDGSVWGWGDDSHGQLGDGTTNNSFVPVQLPAMGLVKAIAAGANHALALLDGGSLWSWGDNSSGQLDRTTQDSAPGEIVGFSMFSAQMVSAPNIFPVEGLFTKPIEIALTETTTGAAIRYTLDGSDPGQGASLYSGPFALTDSAIVRAKGVLSGWSDSDIASAEITIYSTAAMPTVSPAAGNFNGSVDVELACATAGSEIRYTTDGTDPTVASPLYVNAVPLTSSAFLKARAFVSGMNASPVAAAQFADSSTTATPIIFQLGSNVAAAKTVIIGCATFNAAIHYTLDGSEPTLASNGITPGVSLTITQSQTLKAKAWSSGLAPSLTASAVYTITGMASGGARHTLILKADGTVWAVGGNGNGQLGTGSTDDTSTISQVPGLSDVIAVEAGSYHSLALKRDGTVWAWGNNDAGRLGNGELEQQNIPVPVVGLTEVIAIAAGETYSAALKNDGTVWTWGSNACGQLGNGTYDDSSVPVQVPGLGDVTALAAGDYHVLALRSAGDVWAWGLNANGQLGDGANEARPRPVPVTGLDHITAVAAGSAHGVALDAAGRVWTWGDNDRGQLGDGTQDDHWVPALVNGIDQVMAVAAGSAHTLALCADGTLWAWGWNNVGQLGDGTTQDRLVPTRIYEASNLASIAAGRSFSLALTTDGSLYGWGRNLYGQLADPSGDDHSSLVRMSGAGLDFVHLLTSPTIYPFGGKFVGAAALTLQTDVPNVEIRYTFDGSDPTESSPLYEGPLTVSATACIKAKTFKSGFEPSGVTSAVFYKVRGSREQLGGLASGDGFNLQLATDGTVWSWGRNNHGQLGQGNTEDNPRPTQIDNLSEVDAVAAGAASSLALKGDGTLWSWGANESGQLGLGYLGDQSLPVQISNLNHVMTIAMGRTHALAVEADGTLWSWGANQAGQLGDGTTIPHNVASRITSLDGVVAVAAGSTHSLALRADGTVWAWGANDHGQLGDGTNIAHFSPVQVGGLSSVIAVAAGDVFSMALCSDGRVWTWGDNSKGQLGDGSNASRNYAGKVHVDAVDSFPELGNIVTVAAGAAHGIALAANGIVYTWGENGQGQLGQEFFGPQFLNYAEPLLALHNVTAIAAGVNNTLAISNGVLMAWGSNQYGQLGDPGVLDQNAPYAVPPPGAQVSMSTTAAPTIWPQGTSLFTAPVDVTLATLTPHASVAYTLDGADPTPDSSAYDQPFTLSSSVQLRAQAYRQGWYDSAISGASITFYRAVETPAITTPTNIWSFSDSVIVQISCSTVGAEIHYTLDGSDPTVASPLYSNSLNLADSVLVKARAFVSGMNASSISQQQVAKNLAVAAPLLNPAPGQYATGQYVTISSTTSGAEIHYTLDGSEPTLASATVKSNRAVAVAGSISVKAKAWKNGSNPSQTSSGNYTIIGAVAAGNRHLLMLRSDGTVWAAGANDKGQLGDGTITDRSAPVRIHALDDMIAVEAGGHHSLALKRDGTVFAWGANESGQLGTQSSESTCVIPTQVPISSRVVAVAAGENWSLALTADGEVYAWGDNSYGQLGNGLSVGSNVPLKVPGLGGVVALSAGYYHALALRSAGDIWAWGANGHGQLGDGSAQTRYRPTPVNGLDHAIAVAAGGYHSIALKSDGHIWGWGADKFRQLGDDAGLDRSYAAPVAGLPAGVQFISLAAGNGHALAVSKDGVAWAWGKDNLGQLGDGMTSVASAPIQVAVVASGAVMNLTAGQNFSVALKKDGTLKSWGNVPWSQQGSSGTGAVNGDGSESGNGGGAGGGGTTGSGGGGIGGSSGGSTGTGDGSVNGSGGGGSSDSDEYDPTTVDGFNSAGNANMPLPTAELTHYAAIDLGVRESPIEINNKGVILVNFGSPASLPDCTAVGDLWFQGATIHLKAPSPALIYGDVVGMNESGMIVGNLQNRGCEGYINYKGSEYNLIEEQAVWQVPSDPTTWSQIASVDPRIDHESLFVDYGSMYYAIFNHSFYGPYGETQYEKNLVDGISSGDIILYSRRTNCYGIDGSGNIYSTKTVDEKHLPYNPLNGAGVADGFLGAQELGNVGIVWAESTPPYGNPGWAQTGSECHITDMNESGQWIGWRMQLGVANAKSVNLKNDQPIGNITPSRINNGGIVLGWDAKQNTVLNDGVNHLVDGGSGYAQALNNAKQLSLNFTTSESTSVIWPQVVGYDSVGQGRQEIDYPVIWQGKINQQGNPMMRGDGFPDYQKIKMEDLITHAFYDKASLKLIDINDIGMVVGTAETQSDTHGVLLLPYRVAVTEDRVADSATDVILRATVLVPQYDPVKKSMAWLPATDGTTLNWSIVDGNGNALPAAQSALQNGYAAFLLKRQSGVDYNVQVQLASLNYFGRTAQAIGENAGSIHVDAVNIAIQWQGPPPLTDEEAAGSRYRKIALNGLPLADEKPQQQPETDHESEESYIDALTLTLRHSTTDIFVPLPGGELALTVRRNSEPEIWSMRSGLRPEESINRPFGMGWSSNIGANIHFVYQTPFLYTSLEQQADYAYVTDDDGATHRFLISYENGNTHFLPLPSASHEQETYYARLEADANGYVFTKKYGGTLHFKAMPELDKTLPSDRITEAITLKGIETHKFARLTSSADRLGNQLDYQYAAASDFVPNLIANHANAAQAITIQSEEGLITEIIDPRGSHYTFGYAPDASPGAKKKLISVLGPMDANNHRLETKYDYSVVEEPDSNPDQSKPTVYYHCDLSAVTDARNKSYGFDYQFDHTHQIYCNTYKSYPRNGVPRNVVKVNLPDGLGSASFANHSYSSLRPPTVANGNPTFFGHRDTFVTDAVGNSRLYRFLDTEVITLNDAKRYLTAAESPTSILTPRMTVFDRMEITYFQGHAVQFTDAPDSLTWVNDSNNPPLGKETFKFNRSAGMALSDIQDFSGNHTSFAYADQWSVSQQQSWYTGYYPIGSQSDPTSQTNALTHTKTFHYDSAHWRLMDWVQDEEGRKTQYALDDLGRRRMEQIFDSNGSLVQQTAFEYENSDFPAFLTKKTISRIGSSDPAWATDLIVAYEADGFGRTAEEIVDPAGQHLVTHYTYDLNNNRLTATNPRTFTTRFQYDERNRLIEVDYPVESGKPVENKFFGYDDAGNKTKETDENGHATTFVYDGLNRLSSVSRLLEDGTNVTTSYDYNAVGSRISVTDPRNHTATSAYDGLQRLTLQTDARSQSTHFEYGANSGASAFNSSTFKPTKITDPRGHTQVTDYDALYRPSQTAHSVALTSGAAPSVTHAEYDNVGNARFATDPLGHVTETVYDALNRPVRVNYADGTSAQNFYTSTGLKWKVQDELLRETEMHYDSAGRAIEVLGPPADPVGAPTIRPLSKTIYDPAGNISATINPLQKQWDFVYDRRNRKTCENQPEVFDADSGQLHRPQLRCEYDLVGNVTATVDARNQRGETTYDWLNRPVKNLAPAVMTLQPDGTSASVHPTTLTEYDENGHPTKVTDANGHATTNVYDNLDRLYSTTDAENQTVIYGYDGVGNRTSVQDANLHTTAFEYDGLNRNTAIIDSAQVRTSFGFDALNKTSRTDANGKVTSYDQYDSRNRLEHVHYAESPQDDRTYSYDAAGQLLSVTEAGHGGATDSAYTYDGLGRVHTETSAGATHTYAYDLGGNRTSAQYGLAGGGNGRLMISEYDALNRSGKLTDNAQVTQYAYDLAGHVRTKTLPDGEVETTNYDALGRASDASGSTGGGALLYAYNYAYDATSNLRSMGEYKAGLSTRCVTMEYDQVNRLKVEAVHGGSDASAPLTSSTSYTYDAASNRKTMTVGGGSGTIYTYNDLNQLTGFSDTAGRSVVFGYDANGNRTSRTESGAAQAYAYDLENRLIGLDKAGVQYSYLYDYRTRRVARNEGSEQTRVVFSGGTSVQEYAGTSTVPSVEFIRGSDWGGGVGGILYSVRGGAASFAHYDGRGDVATRTDAQGTVTYQANYEAWGTRTAEYGSSQDRQRANTKEEDPTGLLDEGQRYRDLETGVFLTRDPAGFVDGPNLYAYVNQNPWSKFDPEGLQGSETIAKSTTELASDEEVAQAMKMLGRGTRIGPIGVALTLPFLIKGDAGPLPGLGAQANARESMGDYMGAARLRSAADREEHCGVAYVIDSPERADAWNTYIRERGRDPHAASNLMQGLYTPLGADTEDALKPWRLIRYSMAESPREAEAGSRQTAIDRAWRLEASLIMATGRGTREWTQKELIDIKNGQSYIDLGYTGHHINGVKSFPQWKGDPRNIQFMKQGPGEEHMKIGHPGGTRVAQPEGLLIDREMMIQELLHNP